MLNSLFIQVPCKQIGIYRKRKEKKADNSTKSTKSRKSPYRFTLLIKGPEQPEEDSSIRNSNLKRQPGKDLLKYGFHENPAPELQVNINKENELGAYN